MNWNSGAMEPEDPETLRQWRQKPEGEKQTQEVPPAPEKNDKLISLGNGYLLQRVPSGEEIAIICLEEHEFGYGRLLWVGQELETGGRTVAEEHYQTFHAGTSGQVTKTDQHPYGEPVTEIDEDFYIFGKVVMCRLEHDTAEGNILGEMPEDDSTLQQMLSDHDRVHHQGP